ncbi:hypothetical protein ENBRE01_2270 [Enteropsectra breve]|nr:hypothetical protein ENBRE01_2270 [Enteropsectra breve]
MLGSIDSLLILIACSRCTSVDRQEEDIPQEIAAGSFSELADALDRVTTLSDTHSNGNINQVTDSVNPAVDIQAEASVSCSRTSDNSISSTVISRRDNLNESSVDAVISDVVNRNEGLDLSISENHEGEINHSLYSDFIKNKIAEQDVAKMLKVKNGLSAYIKKLLIRYICNRDECTSELLVISNKISEYKILINDILKSNNIQIAAVSCEVEEIKEIREQIKIMQIAYKAKEDKLQRIKQLSNKLVQDLMANDKDSDFKQKLTNDVDSFKTMAKEAGKEYYNISTKYLELYNQLADNFESISNKLSAALQNEKSKEKETYGMVNGSQESAGNDKQGCSDLIEILEADYFAENNAYNSAEGSSLLTESELKELEENSRLYQLISKNRKWILHALEEYGLFSDEYKKLSEEMFWCEAMQELMKLPVENELFKKELDSIEETYNAMRLKFNKSKAIADILSECFRELVRNFNQDRCTNEQIEENLQNCMNEANNIIYLIHESQCCIYETKRKAKYIQTEIKRELILLEYGISLKNEEQRAVSTEEAAQSSKFNP